MTFVAIKNGKQLALIDSPSSLLLSVGHTHTHTDGQTDTHAHTEFCFVAMKGLLVSRPGGHTEK